MKSKEQTKINMDKKLPKNKVKAPILVIGINYATHSSYQLVYRVTEKVISVLYNEMAVGDYRRSDGYSRTYRPTGLAAVGRSHLTYLNKLEEWLKQNGKPSKVKVENYRWVGKGAHKDLQKFYEVVDTYVYDSGWRPALNSREEIVRDVPKLESGVNPVKWLKDQGFEVIDLRKD